MTKEEIFEMAISKGLEPIGEYHGLYKKMDFKCMYPGCGKVVSIQPQGIKMKTGYGCRGCSRRDTKESFQNKLWKIHPNINIISDYVDSKTKIKCECTIDGWIWDVRPNDLLTGRSGCPVCNNHMYLTPDQFKKQFEENSTRDIKLLSDFVNHNTPIHVKCKIDGFEWDAYPYDLLHNRSGCRMCNGKATYTTESFKEKLHMVNPTILVTGEYVSSKTNIGCKCLVCGHEWEAQPGNLLNGRTGCPICKKERSKGERRIIDYLNSKEIKYKLDKKYDGLVGVGNKPLSYDFYLEDYNTLIEYHGKQHEQSIDYYGGQEIFEHQVEHDKRKQEYAKTHDIKLIVIWYYDFTRIEKILDDELKGV